MQLAVEGKHKQTGCYSMCVCVCVSAYSDCSQGGLGVSGDVCVSALFGRRVYDYRFVKTQAT